MVLGVVLGVVLAVMRLSPNPVLRWSAWVYLWIFRGTPVYVQLVFWGLFTSLYPHLDFGIPFVHQFAHFNIQSVNAAFFFAVARPRARTRPPTWRRSFVPASARWARGRPRPRPRWACRGRMTMRRIVLPQAMRVIIPPTGNEVISMLKTTSLVTAVPLHAGPLRDAARDISGVIFQPIPLLLVASTWYLAITSVLMIGQYFLESRFARGSYAAAHRRGSYARQCAGARCESQGRSGIAR